MKKAICILTVVFLLMSVVSTFGAEGGNYSTSFGSASDMDAWQAYHGSWAVEDGVLKQKVDDGSWVNRITLKDKMYKDFTVEVDTKITGGIGFPFLLLRKSNPQDTQDDSGYKIFLMSNGNVGILRAGEVLADVAADNYKAGEFNKLKVTMDGNTIKIYLNDSATPFVTKEDTMFREGYVSLHTGLASADFDNFKITAKGSEEAGSASSNPKTSDKDAEAAAPASSNPKTSDTSIGLIAITAVSSGIAALGLKKKK